MITLPNGTSIDLDMLETAMEDSDLGNRYFLSLLLLAPSAMMRLLFVYAIMIEGHPKC